MVGLVNEINFLQSFYTAFGWRSRHPANAFLSKLVCDHIKCDRQQNKVTRSQITVVRLNTRLLADNTKACCNAAQHDRYKVIYVLLPVVRASCSASGSSALWFKDTRLALKNKRVTLTWTATRNSSSP